jgi:hypothetical protein
VGSAGREKRQRAQSGAAAGQQEQVHAADVCTLQRLADLYPAAWPMDTPFDGGFRLRLWLEGGSGAAQQDGQEWEPVW